MVTGSDSGLIENEFNLVVKILNRRWRSKQREFGSDYLDHLSG